MNKMDLRDGDRVRDTRDGKCYRVQWAQPIMDEAGAEDVLVVGPVGEQPNVWLIDEAHIERLAHGR